MSTTKKAEAYPPRELSKDVPSKLLVAEFEKKGGVAAIDKNVIKRIVEFYNQDKPVPELSQDEGGRYLHIMLIKDLKIENNKKDDKSYIVTLMYSQNFGKTVAEEMKPKIENAIKTDTLDGYRELDKEWGQNKVDSEGQTAVSKYDQIKEYLITNYFGEQ
ncbi:29515_t:CDS:2, partial [Racocetra persica]